MDETIPVMHNSALATATFAESLSFSRWSCSMISCSSHQSPTRPTPRSAEERPPQTIRDSDSTGRAPTSPVATRGGTAPPAAPPAALCSPSCGRRASTDRTWDWEPVGPSDGRGRHACLSAAPLSNQVGGPRPLAASRPCRPAGRMCEAAAHRGVEVEHVMSGQDTYGGSR